MYRMQGEQNDDIKLLAKRKLNLFLFNFVFRHIQKSCQVLDCLLHIFQSMAVIILKQYTIRENLCSTIPNKKLQIFNLPIYSSTYICIHPVHIKEQGHSCALDESGKHRFNATVLETIAISYIEVNCQTISQAALELATGQSLVIKSVLSTIGTNLLCTSLDNCHFYQDSIHLSLVPIMGYVTL